MMAKYPTSRPNYPGAGQGVPAGRVAPCCWPRAAARRRRHAREHRRTRPAGEYAGRQRIFSRL